MKLTIAHKEAFIDSVMSDVPKINFDNQYNKVVKDDMLKNAPPKIKAVLEDKELKHILLTGNNSVAPLSKKRDNEYYSAYQVEIYAVTCYPSFKLSGGASQAADAIMEGAIAQYVARSKLADDTRSAIQSCNTLAQAHKLLPEFGKYLPVQTSPTQMLPAIANLAADLTKAGWPKELVPA